MQSVALMAQMLCFSNKFTEFTKGSEVILPAMTYCSTLFSVMRCNLKPILVDIDKNTSTISVEEIKK